jgi:hypothetical protein
MLPEPPLRLDNKVQDPPTPSKTAPKKETKPVSVETTEHKAEVVAVKQEKTVVKAKTTKVAPKKEKADRNYQRQCSFESLFKRKLNCCKC